MWKQIIALTVIILTGSITVSATETGRVFVIGLDGASHDRMQECIQRNDLTNLQDLAQDGGLEPLDSPLPPLTPVALSTFLTGTNPGEHGIYGFEKQKTLSYETNLVHSQYLDTTLPEALDTKSIMINVPMTYPAPEINGTVVSGFPGSTEGKYAWPPTVKDRLKEMNYSVNTAGTFKDMEELEEEVFSLYEKRQQLALDFMDEKEWSFFMVMFTGDARLQHFKSPEECEESLDTYYSQLDDFIGRVDSKLNDNDTLIVFSNHGFQELDKKVYLFSFLKDNGYLKPDTWLFYKHMLQDIGGSILSTLGLSGDKGELSNRATFSSDYMNEIDWSGTDAYTGSFYNGQVFINKKDVQPEGQVTEDEYTTVQKNIMDDLEQLRDPETGEKIVENIYTKEEIYSGQQMEQMPDIVFETPGYNHIAKFGFGDTFLDNPAERSAPVRTGFVASNRPIRKERPDVIDLPSSIGSLLDHEFGNGDIIFQEDS